VVKVPPFAKPQTVRGNNNIDRMIIFQEELKKYSDENFVVAWRPNNVMLFAPKIYFRKNTTKLIWIKSLKGFIFSFLINSSTYFVGTLIIFYLFKISFELLIDPLFLIVQILAYFIIHLLSAFSTFNKIKA
jgi:hypothetical protein